MTAAAMPSPGDVVYVGPGASVQFAGSNGIRFRVIRILDWPTYEGWTWIDGYQLNGVGDAVARRSIFVQIAGLRSATEDRPTAR